MEYESVKITVNEITKEMVLEPFHKWHTAAEKAQEAAKAYFSDLEQRKAALKNQAQSYHVQLDRLKCQRKTLEAKVVDLSSRGLIDKAAEADTRMENLDKKISSLERKLRMVDAAEPKGDPGLYHTAKTALDDMEAEEQRYHDFTAGIFAVIREERQRLFEITEAIPGSNVGFNLNARADFNRVDRHFRELDRLEREANERRKAEQKAAEVTACAKIPLSCR